VTARDNLVEMRRKKPARYTVRLAADESDLARAQSLRWRCFLGGVGKDADRFDARCQHVLVEEPAAGRAVCTFRFMPLPDGGAIGQSYSAQFYDLARLSAFTEPMAELGRFCIDPDCRDPDILRHAWGALADYVLSRRIALLFGCTSFPGTGPEPYLETFALLREAHQAPPEWRPGLRAQEVVRFDPARRVADRVTALRAMPPLLRSYLGMGGWVSDHAVIDRDLGTLHVFTGLETSKVPVARIRALRAAVQSGAGGAVIPPH
jgi:L-ornithine Nalpha-acyltransferase